MADYQQEDIVYELNKAGAVLAKEVAQDHGGFVAGVLGPTNRTCSIAWLLHSLAASTGGRPLALSDSSSAISLRTRVAVRSSGW